MKKTMPYVLSAVALAHTSLAMAQAGDFPAKPIQVVVNSTAGSLSEALTRFLGQDVQKTLGQPLVIVAKPSVNAAVGTDFVKRSLPDGYTLVLGSNTSMAANVHLVKNLTYAPLDDFEPVSLASINPLVLVARSSLPIKSVAELVNYAKARPGDLTYGVGNAGAKVAATLLTSLAGFEALEVPFKGASQAVQEVLAGRVDFMAVDALVVDAHIKSGALRALAVTSSARLQSMPDVPTMEEAGVKGYEYSSFTAFYAPKGTPKPVVDKLNKAFVKAIESKEAQAYYARMGMIGKASSPQELQAFTVSQIAYWGRLVKLAKMEAQ